MSARLTDSCQMHSVVFKRLFFRHSHNLCAKHSIHNASTSAGALSPIMGGMCLVSLTISCKTKWLCSTTIRYEFENIGSIGELGGLPVARGLVGVQYVFEGIHATHDMYNARALRV